MMDTISLLRKYQVGFNILTVVNRETSRNIQGSMSFIKKTDFFISSISHACPLLRRVGCRTLFFLSAEDHDSFLKSAVCGSRIGSRAGSPHIRFFENLIGRLGWECRWNLRPKRRLRIQYAVEADGTVYPCDFYTPIPTGWEI